MKSFITFILLALLLTMTLSAQTTVTAIADVVSLSQWRGQSHNTWGLQGGVSVSTQEFQFGAWGDYGGKTDFSEIDLWAKFAPSENFFVQIIDHQYPYVNSDAFNFENKNTGSHYPEVGAGVNVADNALSFYGSAFVYNDTTFSPYVQGTYNFNINTTPVSLFAGGTYGKTCMYNTTEDKFQFVNVGVTVTPINKLSVTYLVNPNEKTNFVVFKLSLL